MLTTEAQHTRILSDFLTEESAAAELNLQPRTLRKYRERGEGPAFVKVGRRTMYRRSDIADWLREQTIKPVRASRKSKVA